MLVQIIKRIFRNTRPALDEKQGEPGEKHHPGDTGTGLSPEHVLDRFDEITGIAEIANSELAAAGRPFQFRVHRDGADIYIDILTTASPGEEEQIARKNITHYEFHELVKNLENLEGMLLDIET